MIRILSILIVAITIVSCKSGKNVTVNEDGKDLPYRKVAKQQDPELKYLYADKYFQNEDYFKALTLYEELIPIWRLTEKGRTAYYRYALCYYKMKDYYLAGYYFKQFHKNNYMDERAEDALFLTAICKVKTSPHYSLDQTDTRKAIEGLQLFLDKYPETERRDSANTIIDKLYDKLDRKKYEWAYLYYKTENYKSAVIAFDVCLEEFPQSDYKEEIYYYKLRSHYLFAENSVESKKMERYEETIKSYRKFVSAFPESDFRKSADNIFESSEAKLESLKTIESIQ